MPSTLINFIDTDFLGNHLFLNFVLGILFYVQYFINIFIYAAKSDQYKKAYKYFLRQVYFSVRTIKP